MRRDVLPDPSRVRWLARVTTSPEGEAGGDLCARRALAVSSSCRGLPLTLPPELSARAAMWRWQKVGLLALSLAFALGLLAEPRATLIGLFAALALPFLFVVLLRGVALWAHFSAPAPDTGAGALEKGEDELPRYSVLVPLFREADVVGDLVAALSRIDYPPDRLEVLLVTESVDEETRAAIAGTPLPAHMQVVVVPDGTPRTKPRALNHALELASGEFVVVYDAEDCPEPSQLRRALAVFAGSVAPVGCVQARLNIYNPRQNWLTRQFTIEYTALFDCLLPALERLGLPVPLGGTSNHFPRPVLEEVGGWDAYNVTEDADLGIRLARAGFEIRVLESTTWEEAPARLGGWLRQRTRWLKGWMQTYLVHMRQPRRLLRELGLFRFAGLQVLMGGMILSALVHPWFYALAAADAARGLAIDVPLTLPSHALWWLGFVNLVAGYVTGMALGVVALAGRGWLRLAAHAALMPLYWLLVSAAAYRALWQLVRAPYVWEKTAHTARGARSSSMPAE